MNSIDIENVKNTIETVMTEYIFVENTENTIDMVTNKIATKLDVNDFYDYTLSVKTDDDGIVVIVEVENVKNMNKTYFVGSTNNVPAINCNEIEQENNFSAFERAMSGI